MMCSHRSGNKSPSLMKADSNSVTFAMASVYVTFALHNDVWIELNASPDNDPLSPNTIMCIIAPSLVFTMTTMIRSNILVIDHACDFSMNKSLKSI